MTAELTSEQIVTNLLSEHEILKRSRDNFYISNKISSLGEYLLNAPKEKVIDEQETKEVSRFSFISGSWNI